MSWRELERLVSDVESDGVIRRAMKRCRSRHEFVLAARRLGYRRRGAKKNPRFPASARNGTDYSRGQTIRQTKLALANSSETESSS